MNKIICFILLIHLSKGQVNDGEMYGFGTERKSKPQPSSIKCYSCKEDFQACDFKNARKITCKDTNHCMKIKITTMKNETSESVQCGMGVLTHEALQQRKQVILKIWDTIFSRPKLKIDFCEKNYCNSGRYLKYSTFFLISIILVNLFV